MFLSLLLSFIHCLCGSLPAGLLTADRAEVGGFISQEVMDFRDKSPAGDFFDVPTGVSDFVNHGIVCGGGRKDLEDQDALDCLAGCVSARGHSLKYRVESRDRSRYSLGANGGLNNPMSSV